MMKSAVSSVLLNLNKTLQISRANIHLTAACNSEMKIEKTVNQITLLGRAGNDAQKRGTAEHPVVIFSLATHNTYKYESGDLIQRTDWHRISVFRPGLRDTVEQYLKKGQRIFVTGRLTYGEVKTESGEVRSTASIIADDVIFLQSRSNDAPPSVE